MFLKIWFKYCFVLNNYNYWYELKTVLLIFYFISFCVVFLIFLLSFLIQKKSIYKEKLTLFECGFEPYGSKKNCFEIQYFIIGLLFLLFDIEIIFLIPWILNLGILNFISIFIMLLFLILLVIGLYYEWKKNALDWI